MKKFLPIIIALALSVGLIGCGAASQVESKKAEEGKNNTSQPNNNNEKKDAIIIRAASANNKENMFTQMEFSFKEKIEKASNGKVKVEVYPDAQLGTDKDTLDGMTLGTVDMVVNASALYANYEPLMGILDLPFIFKDYNQVHKVLDGEVGDTLKKAVLDKSGLRILGFPDGLFRFMYLKEPIQTVDDLKGKKIRAPEAPTYINMIKALGANPVPLAWNDIYTSLKTGVIDGAEGPVDGAYQVKLGEATKALVKSRHIYSPTAMTIRESLYSKLSQEDKDLIQNTAKQVIEEYRPKVQEIEDKYSELFKKDGVQIIEIDNKAFSEKTKNLPAEFVQKFGGKDLLDKILNTK